MRNPSVIFAEESLAVWFVLFLVEQLVKAVEGRLQIAVNVVPPGKLFIKINIHFVAGLKTYQSHTKYCWLKMVPVYKTKVLKVDICG